MKRIVLFLFLANAYALVQGQSKTIMYDNKEYEITYDTIVEDSTGHPYPSATWIDWVMNGEYMLVPKYPGKKNTSFLLEKVSPEEQATFNALPPEESSSFTTGKKISFRGTDINGKKINTKEYEGKIIVVNFWFINCPPCKREIPYLNKLVKEYEADNNIVFIAVAQDGKKALDTFLEKTPFNYRIIVDGSANYFKIDIYPTHLIIDKKGMVAFHTIGYTGRTGYWMRKTIEKLKSQ